MSEIRYKVYDMKRKQIYRYTYWQWQIGFWALFVLGLATGLLMSWKCSVGHIH